MSDFIPLPVLGQGPIIGDMPVRDFTWPQWVKDLMPMLCVFYRPKPGKPRTKKVKRNKMVDGKIVTTTEKVEYKKAKTSGVKDQNNFSVITCVILEPDDFGTIQRNLKHKGYSMMVGAVDPSEKEIERAKHGSRYYFYKYKSFTEMYNIRQVYDEFTVALHERLDEMYPCKATGQAKLF